MGIIRSSFLIDEQGQLEQVWYKISPKDTPKKLLARSLERLSASWRGSVALFVRGEQTGLELLVRLRQRPLPPGGDRADREGDQEEPAQQVGSARVTVGGVGHLVRIGPRSR